MEISETCLTACMYLVMTHVHIISPASSSGNDIILIKNWTMLNGRIRCFVTWKKDIVRVMERWCSHSPLVWSRRPSWVFGSLCWDVIWHCDISFYTGLLEYLAIIQCLLESFRAIYHIYAYKLHIRSWWFNLHFHWWSNSNSYFWCSRSKWLVRSVISSCAYHFKYGALTARFCWYNACVEQVWCLCICVLSLFCGVC